MSFRDTDNTSVVAPRSRALLALDTSLTPLWERETGKLVARSGHRGVWTRGTSTLASNTAANGSYTAPATQPGYDLRTVLGSPMLCLNMGTADSLKFGLGWRPRTVLSGWIRFVETGARTVANATLLSLAGDNPATGVRVHIDTSGTFYRMTYHNGATSVTATLTVGQPTAGQLVDLSFVWTATGIVLSQSINEAAPTTASSGALALPSAFATGASVWINRRGVTANPASMALRACTLAPGSLTLAQLRGLW